MFVNNQMMFTIKVKHTILLYYKFNFKNFSNEFELFDITTFNKLLSLQ